MNILFVSAILPWPLYSGGQIRMYNLLKRLSKRHEITLVSFIRDDSERDLVTHLDFLKNVHVIMRGRAWQPKYVIWAILGRFPFLLTTYHNRLMRQLITDLVSRGQFDLVHIEPFYVWPSLPNMSLPLVVSEHNIEYDVYHSYVDHLALRGFKPFFLWDVGKIRKWERLVWRTADRLTAVSLADAAVMEKYLSHPIAVVPNGVDLSAFRYRKPIPKKNPTILFVGNFRWYPNRDAASVLVDRIWPEINRYFPSSQLCIAGRDIPGVLRSRILKCGGRVMDNVEEIAALYQSADVFVAPHSIAGGTKFKMLEAMATGLPIVTTKQGMNGIDAEPGVHYFEAATDAEFIAQIRAVWDNTTHTQTIAVNARKRIETLYDWNNIASSLEQVWKNTYAKK